MELEHHYGPDPTYWRDNARTLCSGPKLPQAGFTTGRPWLAVNPNYQEINVEAALADPSSIFIPTNNWLPSVRTRLIDLCRL